MNVTKEEAALIASGVKALCSAAVRAITALAGGGPRNVITNSSFDTDQNWSYSLGWSFVEGTMRHDGISPGYASYTQLSETLPVGATVTLRVTVHAPGGQSGSINGRLWNDANLSRGSGPIPYDGTPTAREVQLTVSSGDATRFGLVGIATALVFDDIELIVE